MPVLVTVGRSGEAMALARLIGPHTADKALLDSLERTAVPWPRSSRNGVAPSRLELWLQLKASFGPIANNLIAMEGFYPPRQARRLFQQRMP